MTERSSNSILSQQDAEALVNQMIRDNGGLHNLSTTEILQAAMNIIMKAERDLHLQQHPDDKGNGYFQRGIGTANGTLTVQVPRDRNGDFRPKVLPERYARDSRERQELLRALLASHYSQNDIRRIFHELGLHYNPDEIEQLKKNYLEQFNAWKARQLPEDAIALFIDAYIADALIDGKVRKTTVFVVLGVDFNGHKELWDLSINSGPESKSFWLQVLNGLIERGLKQPLLIVSDNFSGLKDACQTLFPLSLHQLCLVHLQRNIYRNMGRNDAHAFFEEISRIKLDISFDDGLSRFNSVLDSMQNLYPTFISSLRADAPHYLAFLRLPKPVQKHFYTTNAVESFNSTLETLRIDLGGFFQSHDTLKVAVFIAYSNLRLKWRHGIPAVIANLYQIRQLFAQIYGRLPVA